MRSADNGNYGQSVIGSTFRKLSYDATDFINDDHISELIKNAKADSCARDNSEEHGQKALAG